MTDEKQFDEWNEFKKYLHDKNKQWVFHEREIWWYACGENIGREINGKNKRFSRPVLILRKYGKESFFGVPLSSRIHEGFWYETIENKGEKINVLLSQAGSFSVNRLLTKMGKIPKRDFVKITGKLGYVLFGIK